MLTALTIRNFKQFDEVRLELGKAVVFIGPNNSGKTSALQALTLWEIGLRQWLAKRGDKARPEKRPGVTINRRDLLAVPVPAADLLWRDRHLRNARQEDGKQRTQNVRIDVSVEGVTNGHSWACGLEFDYSNEESFVCRPVRKSEFQNAPVAETQFTEMPDAAGQVRVAYLPPMSGLIDREFLKQPGEVGYLIGQGQTAQVLRNLCHQVFQRGPESWNLITDQIQRLFGMELLEPEVNTQLAEIQLQYRSRTKCLLDISSAGRGVQQTLLLLAYLHVNPRAVLLLDEPDAHLEILRQRQIFTLLMDTAEKHGSQIIAASHSEVVLNEAVSKGRVIAFVGKPHVINDRGSQALKALTEIGFEDYYQAEQTGWVLYLEDATDLAILQVFAESLGHREAQTALERPFVRYLGNNVPQQARDHFYGLREAKPDLLGLALFDRLDKTLNEGTPLQEMMWQRREIENYFCTREVLLGYAKGRTTEDLFAFGEQSLREQAMNEGIAEVSGALSTFGKPDPWSVDIKATDEFLDPLFRSFSKRLGLPLVLRKSDYHTLAGLVAPEALDPEVREKLDAIAAVAGRATPAVSPAP